MKLLNVDIYLFVIHCEKLLLCSLSSHKRIFANIINTLSVKGNLTTFVISEACIELVALHMN